MPGMQPGSLHRLWGEAGTSHTRPFISRISKPQPGLIRPPPPTPRTQHAEAPPAERSSVVNAVPGACADWDWDRNRRSPNAQPEHAGCPGQAPPLSGLQPSHLQRVPPALAMRPAAVTPASEKSRGAMGTAAWPLSTHTPGQGTHLAAPLHSHATTHWPQDKFASLHLRAAVLSSPRVPGPGQQVLCVCASSPRPLINTGRLCKLSLGGHTPSCFRTPPPTGQSQDTEQT